MPSSSYEIRVTGLLPPEVLADFSTLTAAVQPVSTVVYGSLASQSHLHALLARLEVYGARVLEIRCLRLPGEQKRQACHLMPDSGP